MYRAEWTLRLRWYAIRPWGEEAAHCAVSGLDAAAHRVGSTAIPNGT